ncbi:hypothetical protein SISNIDRAFT_538041 [Sistotremastrum niveocremeum HHB9708]|uniref:Uncharacterized protein n=1 Tax=Sistotremastrum niveocremeum HHB9708 TaxID=1314777 RepID=A0A164MZ16_9AGAM|nr:hypothetical protein SISNIDRAFT_538041 [Sistotremastrum niveocremeum HHB9708]
MSSPAQHIRPANGYPLSDIITYRYKQDMVYVTPAQNYIDAVQSAKDVFPSLRAEPIENITLALNVSLGDGVKPVRIAPAVWPAVRATVAKYEILEVDLSEKPVYDKELVYNKAQVVKSEWLMPPPEANEEKRRSWIAQLLRP